MLSIPLWSIRQLVTTGSSISRACSTEGYSGWFTALPQKKTNKHKMTQDHLRINFTLKYYYIVISLLGDVHHHNHQTFAKITSQHSVYIVWSILFVPAPFLLLSDKQTDRRPASLPVTIIQDTKTASTILFLQHNTNGNTTMFSAKPFHKFTKMAFKTPWWTNKHLLHPTGLKMYMDTAITIVTLTASEQEFPHEKKGAAPLNQTTYLVAMFHY